MRIRVQKRAEVTGGFPAISFADHVPGTVVNENFSLPIDYWAEGELLAPITVGQPVYIARTVRNGVACPGLMQTSTVTEVTDKSFSTRNSVYDYSFLTEPSEDVSLPA